MFNLHQKEGHKNHLSNILVGVHQKGQILPSRDPIHFRFCFTLFQSSSLVWLRLDFAPHRHPHQTNLIKLIAFMIVIILETKFDKTDPEFFISLQFNSLQLSALQFPFSGILKFDLKKRVLESDRWLVHKSLPYLLLI